MKIKDELGNRYGKLKVIKYDGSRNNRARWKCLCDCGNKTIVDGSMLRSNKIKSCGCLRDKKTSNRFKTHGLSHTNIYDVWIKMKARCFNKNNKDYRNYGNRGINVYNQWINNFQSFYDWAINNGYKENLTIERIDVSGNYEPKNCIWIKNEEQALNRQKSHKYTYRNETKGIRYFSKKYKINYNTLRARLLNYNWDIKKAIEIKPIRGSNQYETKTVSNTSS